MEYYGISTEAQAYCAVPGLYPLYEINHEPRGNTETKSVWNADLSVSKAFTVGPTDMSVILSVYNLFDRELDNSFNSTAFRVTSEESGLGDPVYENGPDEDPTFYIPIGQPLSYRYPRRYELGFRLTF